MVLGLVKPVQQGRLCLVMQLVVLVLGNEFVFDLGQRSVDKLITLSGIEI